MDELTQQQPRPVGEQALVSRVPVVTSLAGSAAARSTQDGEFNSSI